MIDFRSLSIRLKLLLIVLGSVFVSLLIAMSAIGILNYKSTSKDFTEQLNVLVDITTERSKAALAFRDKRAISANLAALAKMSAIQNACVYDDKKQLFVEYSRVAQVVCERSINLQQETASNSILSVIGAMELNGRTIGHLQVLASTKPVTNRVWQFVLYSFFITLVSGLLAYLMSSRLQMALVLPIITLSRLAKKISSTRDFSLRAKVYNDDEAGTLAKSFNALIGNIQDSQIQMHEMVLELQEKTTQLESHTELVEDRNRVIRNLFAGASHDLRQPLQAMALFVDALNDMCDERQKELLGKLELAIRNMRKLFDDLLDMQKLEGRLNGQINRGSVNLKPLLESVFHECDMLAQDKKLELRMHMRDIVVDSNASMLERIIRNLLSNAIRYTDRGGILLASRKRGTDIWIEIWDTGRGIPQDQMEKVFAQFYQVERVSNEGKQGYGLGLSIVKRLSEMLDHRIEIHSREGRGTMFRIHVPLYLEGSEELSLGAPPSHQVQAPNADQAVQTISQLPGEKANILLIDDDALVRDSLNTLMTTWGMNVTEFECISDMKAFIENAEDLHFDLMVSDFQLSETETGLDAIACAQTLLSPQEDSPKLPALIVTGANDPEIDLIIKKSGIRKLNKPVKAAKLRALMNHLMAQSKD